MNLKESPWVKFSKKYGIFGSYAWRHKDYDIVKEAWDILEVTHEGTKIVKKVKL